MSAGQQVTGRIVLIGETHVGKTSLVQKYLRGGSLSQEQKSTIGAVFHTTEKEVGGKSITLQIWDTAGQERYKALGPIYYRKSNAAIAVFDVTKRDTMKKLEDWIQVFRENADDNFVVIAANKSDLEDQKACTLDETNEWAHTLGAECIWTSALTGIGVDDLFNAVTQHLTSTNSCATTDTDKKIAESQETHERSVCC